MKNKLLPIGTVIEDQQYCVSIDYETIGDIMFRPEAKIKEYKYKHTMAYDRYIIVKYNSHQQCYMYRKEEAEEWDLKLCEYQHAQDLLTCGMWRIVSSPNKALEVLYGIP